MILSLHGQPHDVAYEERIDGGGMSRRALEATAVRMLITGMPRADLALLQSAGRVSLYGVGNHVAPRVGFFPLSRVAYLDAEQIHRNLADQAYDLSSNLMLPPDARRLAPSTGAPPAEPPAPAIVHRRVSSDEIEVDVTVGAAGFLRVNEAFDPGWRATANGAAVEVVPANDALLAVFLPPGTHAVRFTYHTVGRRTGLVLSLVSLCGLIPFGLWAASTRNRPDNWARSGSSDDVRE
jgi:hypothetical protein